MKAVKLAPLALIFAAGVQAYPGESNGSFELHYKAEPQVSIEGPGDVHFSRDEAPSAEAILTVTANVAYEVTITQDGARGQGRPFLTSKDGEELFFDAKVDSSDANEGIAHPAGYTFSKNIERPGDNLHRVRFSMDKEDAAFAKAGDYSAVITYQVSAKP